MRGGELLGKWLHVRDTTRSTVAATVTLPDGLTGDSERSIVAATVMLPECELGTHGHHTHGLSDTC